MTAALRRLGFNAVFDTNFTADLTILEEGTELLTRLKAALVANVLVTGIHFARQNPLPVVLGMEDERAVHVVYREADSWYGVTVPTRKQ